MPKELEDCVAKRIEEGKSEASAWAICTEMMKKKGMMKPGKSDMPKGKPKGKSKK